MSGEDEQLLSLDATLKSIQEAITQVVRRRKWSLEAIPRKAIWTTLIDGAAASYRCYVQVEPELGSVIFYGVLPFTAPKELHPEAALVLAEINYDLAVGKFELDLRDGELRFSNGIDVRGTRLDPVVFGRMADHAIEMLDAYSQVIRSRLMPRAMG